MLSIIMPSYNQGPFIRQAISSVLDQSYPHKELIVIDGGSTDETLSILRSYGRRIAYWVSENDIGQSDALNKALRQTHGCVVGWINADDYYLPEAFSVVMSAAANAANKLFFYGNNVIVDSVGNENGKQIAFPYSANQLIYEGFHLFTQSFFWRTSAVRDRYVFPTDLHRTMDFHFFLWLGLTYGSSSFQYLNRDLGAFRRHPDQKTTGKGSAVVDAEYAAIDREFGVKTFRLNRNPLKRLFFRCRRAFFYARQYLMKRWLVPR